jgi:protein tyrosine/serine phosphatase
VRDLGDLRTRDGRRTKRGVLVRGSMIGALSPIGATAMRSHGVRTVIDLRWAAEVEAQPSVFANGLVYRNVPVDNDRRLALLDHVTKGTLAEQLAMLARPESGIGEAIDAIAAAEPAVVIHCQAGRDRTGIVVALLLSAIGVVDEDVADDYRASDDALAGEYDRLAKDDASAAAAVTDAIERRRGVMAPVLRAVRQGYGDAERYLIAAGGSPRSIAHLRTMLVA